MSKKKKFNNYPNGGDGMFFYHKKTKHPVKQTKHTSKTWTNKRYTHSPNRLKDYEEDKELSTSDKTVYATKKEFEDPIYTRGRPYNVKKSIDRRTIKFISALMCD